MITYIDCGSGVAGDMLLGALLGLGLPARELDKTLAAVLREKAWALKIARTERQHWPAWSVRVQGDRSYGSIEKMAACVRRSGLPPVVKANAIVVLERLRTAEKQAHQSVKGEFDPQGLGLLDTLVDVVGNCWGFWKLNIKQVTASPLNTGRLAPATAAMLKNSTVPIYSTEASLELATPTGVALLLQFAKEFKSMPEMQLDKTGYGAGFKDTPGRPNVVGVYQGTSSVEGAASLETVLLLETVIDDMDPRLYPHVTDLLFKSGALDVWWSPIGMKKGRPGISFSVLCRPASEKRLLEILFVETTTLGVRRQPVQRWVLPRKMQGDRKVGLLPSGRIKTQREFETARKLSATRAIPLLKLLK